MLLHKITAFVKEKNVCVSKAWSWFRLLPFAAGLSQSRFFCCTIRGVSISCPQPGRVLGPRLGGRRFFRPQHHPSPQPSLPVLGGLAVLFRTFSTKHLFLHPGHVHAQSARDGRWWGDHPAGALVTYIRFLLLSHAVWGSSLCLVQWR